MSTSQAPNGKPSMSAVGIAAPGSSDNASWWACGMNLPHDDKQKKTQTIHANMMLFVSSASICASANRSFLLVFKSVLMGVSVLSEL